MESKVAKLKAELNRVNHRASYWKSRGQVLKEGNALKKKELQDEIKTLKDKVSSMDFENAELNQELQDIMSSEIVVFCCSSSATRTETVSDRRVQYFAN